ncbi:hypothetical protein BZB76_6217 [Actinomadura pelletieri DSM 43383]|uniref:Uncharacterized protein n=1 Tax=Actinomadura pelletieri DSM 43383 TaxID=1120940 RepID=A0A495QBM8_9ACTN|nr:hypothetical protein BZB76_6217 [Actinomadura pelletieri DSM 43383]
MNQRQRPAAHSANGPNLVSSSIRAPSSAQLLPSKPCFANLLRQVSPGAVGQDRVAWPTPGYDGPAPKRIPRSHLFRRHPARCVVGGSGSPALARPGAKRGAAVDVVRDVALPVQASLSSPTPALIALRRIRAWGPTVKPPTSAGPSPAPTGPRAGVCGTGSRSCRAGARTAVRRTRGRRRSFSAGLGAAALLHAHIRRRRAEDILYGDHLESGGPPRPDGAGNKRVPRLLGLFKTERFCATVDTWTGHCTTPTSNGARTGSGPGSTLSANGVAIRSCSATNTSRTPWSRQESICHVALCRPRSSARLRGECGVRSPALSFNGDLRDADRSGGFPQHVAHAEEPESDRCHGHLWRARRGQHSVPRGRFARPVTGLAGCRAAGPVIAW